MRGQRAHDSNPVVSETRDAVLFSPPSPVDRSSRCRTPHTSARTLTHLPQRPGEGGGDVEGASLQGKHAAACGDVCEGVSGDVGVCVCTCQETQAVCARVCVSGQEDVSQATLGSGSSCVVGSGTCVAGS